MRCGKLQLTEWDSYGMTLQFLIFESAESCEVERGSELSILRLMMLSQIVP